MRVISIKYWLKGLLVLAFLGLGMPVVAHAYPLYYAGHYGHGNYGYQRVSGWYDRGYGRPYPMFPTLGYNNYYYAAPAYYYPNYPVETIAPPPPPETYVDAGSYCRRFSQQVTVGGQIQESYGTACLQPDGSWRVVQQ